MARKPTLWKCAKCHELKVIGEQIARADQYAVCYGCIAEGVRRDAKHASDPTWRPAAAHGVRRVFRTPGNHDRTRND